MAWLRLGRLSHDLALARHPWVRAIRRHPESRRPIVSGDKGFSSIPYQEARPVHWSIREPPKRVTLVSQKVRRDEGIFIWPNDLSAQRTMSLASFDPLHIPKMSLPANCTRHEAAHRRITELRRSSLRPRSSSGP
jgi:hypothetical protein